MEGEIVSINIQSKVLILKLDNVFQFAGMILNWNTEHGCEGFGINRTVYNFVVGSKFKLLIQYSKEPDKEYWINYDTLRNFVTTTNSLNRVKNNKPLYNIPLSLFLPKPNFSGEHHDL